MTYTLEHNVEESKYEFHIGEHIAYITYDDQNGDMHLTHTIVPDALAGKGLAKCSYIVNYQQKHPEASSLFV